jgi:streptogramin lyase
MPQFNQIVEVRDGDHNVTIRLDADVASVEVGANPANGLLIVRDASDNVVLQVSADTGELSLGSTGTPGIVSLNNAGGGEAIRLDGGDGDIFVKDAAGNVLFHFDSSHGLLRLGGKGEDGDLLVRDAANKQRIRLNGGEGDVWVKSATGKQLFHFDCSAAALYLGGQDNEGDLIVRDAQRKQRIKLDGGEGDIWVKNAEGKHLFHFDSTYAALWLGGHGNEGDLVVRDEANKERIKLDGGEGDIWVKSAEGKHLFYFDSSYAALWLGGHGNEGDLVVRDEANKERIKLDGGEGDIWVKNAEGRTLFHFDSTYAALWLGGQGNEGDLVIRDEANKERIKLDGGEGDMWVWDSSGIPLFHFDSQYAALYLGGAGNEGDLILRNDNGDQTIKLDGGLGDILLSNADAAEQFDVVADAEASPGTVMVLTEKGLLTPSLEPYDSKVVGVVAGAGAYRPGIVMDHRESEEGAVRVPISIMGKVACRADASHGPIAVGDLLTTSSTPGCAMRVADRSRAIGSVIGKALTPLASGTGFVDVLMTLQ